MEYDAADFEVQTVLTVAKGLGITMSELLSGIEKRADAPKQTPKPKS